MSHSITLISHKEEMRKKQLSKKLFALNVLLLLFRLFASH